MLSASLSLTRRSTAGQWHLFCRRHRASSIRRSNGRRTSSGARPREEALTACRAPIPCASPDSRDFSGTDQLRGKLLGLSDRRSPENRCEPSTLRCPNFPRLCANVLPSRLATTLATKPFRPKPSNEEIAIIARRFRAVSSAVEHCPHTTLGILPGFSRLESPSGFVPDLCHSAA